MESTPRWRVHHDGEYTTMEKKTSPRSTQFEELLRSIRLDHKNSDLITVCGDEEYAVRKCIVFPRSDFFAKACDGGLTEPTTNRVVLLYEPTPVRQMIEYPYTLNYHVAIHSSEADPSRQPDEEAAHDRPENHDGTDDKTVSACNALSILVSMYSLADQMCIHGLKAPSKETLEKELTRRWLDSSTFPHAVHEIYKTTSIDDQCLRDLAVKITMDNPVCMRTGVELNPWLLQIP
ncbi:BTB/POZ fold [Penicillium digitatum]|uniref:BTB/POZ fold n=1 Tax=Penicillium digitatum TaxID=36651 RepID=A0A7T7BJ92_PENDI|nr:hypothetical protein PDIDSM_6179 [Penicillium digitatum]QQK41851.1 BTB/POZ fold [Penicillium digitatum]